MVRNSIYFAAFIFLLLGVGCEGFFGEKTSSDFLEPPAYTDRQVAYVPIQPVMDGFEKPVGIIAGFDELIYVADAGAEEVIGFDQSGNELGRFPIPGLKAIAQDRRLDILASGTRDTTISGTQFTLPAIYRLNLKSGSSYGIQNAKIVNVIIHPFYFKSSTPTTSDEQVSFEGIDILGNNRYYVTRNGPSNFPNQFGGPDDAVLIFAADDEYTTPVAVTTNIGLFRNYFKSPKGISTLAKPPQSPAVNGQGTFTFASTDPATVIKVQVIQLLESEFGSSYIVVPLPVGDTTKADGFLYEPNRFSRPMGVTRTGDGTNYIFVVDADKDSVYQFNALGYEGVAPPAGSNETKAIRVSFGGTGESLSNFREPQGVAYLRQILYVADTGNRRVLRFKLTTDFD